MNNDDYKKISKVYSDSVKGFGNISKTYSDNMQDINNLIKRTSTFSNNINNIDLGSLYTNKKGSLASETDPEIIALTEKIEELLEYKNAAESEISELKTETQKAIDLTQKKVKELENSTLDIQDSIDTKNSHAISTITIFVTFFTFISVNITIFQKVENIGDAFFFMLLMAFCSLLIVSPLLAIINSYRKNLRAIKVYAAFFLFSLLGLCLSAFYIGNNFNNSLQSKDFSPIDVEMIDVLPNEDNEKVAEIKVNKVQINN